MSHYLEYSISKVENEKCSILREVQYPQVVKYDEEDMMLIKEVLTRHQRWRNENTRDAIFTLSGKVAQDLNIKIQGINRKTLLEDVVKDYVVLTR